MTKALPLACLILAVGVSESAIAGCGGRVRMVENQTVDRFMTLRAGKQCSVNLTSSLGPTFGAEIVERPKHGRAFVQAPHQVVYVASARYTGPDSFTYARNGLSTQNSPVTQTVRVTVTVDP
jgi:hypothetical protein